MNILLSSKEFIFQDDRPFRSCHASTLVVLGNGDVLAAWFGGTKEKNSDVAIWASKRRFGQWSEPVKIADEEGTAHWNPVLFQDANERVTLFYKVGEEILDWYTKVAYSSDGGETWSEPKELVEGDRGGRGPVKNKPIQLRNGAIAAPASIQKPDPEKEGNQIWEAFADLSLDNGETWNPGSKVPIDYSTMQGQLHSRAKGLIQPTLWESSNQLHMLLRSTEGKVFRSESSDGGKTWTTAYPSGLPNNNSGIDLVGMDNGMLALVYNPVEGYTASTPRTPLWVSFSTDNGESWGNEVVLEEEQGEFSYPAIVARNNELFITYTWNRERIVFRHMVISLAE